MFPAVREAALAPLVEADPAEAARGPAAHVAHPAWEEAPAVGVVEVGADKEVKNQEEL